MRSALTYVFPVIKSIIVGLLVAFSFFSVNYVTLIVFMSLLIYFVLRILKQTSTSSSPKVQFMPYLVQLKWFLFSFYLVICILRVVDINIDSSSTSEADEKSLSKWVRLVGKVRNAKKAEFDIVLLIICFYLYLKEIYIATKMNFFDVELSGDMGKYYLYISEWVEGQDICSESLMATYFTQNLLRINNLTEEEVFTNTAKFKLSFMVILFEQSAHFKKSFSLFQKKYIDT